MSNGGGDEVEDRAMIAAQQIREARRLLNWLPATLADKAGLAVGVVRRAEQTSICTVDSLVQIQRALEAAGVEFIPENSGAGVRLKRHSSTGEP